MELGAAGNLGLTDLYHVGIAVRDLDDAIARLAGALGIERWATLDTEVPARYRGEDTTLASRVAYGRSGSSYVELVQPTGGRWTAQAYLDEHGEGAYHLGYWVEDMRGTLERAERAGLGVDLVMTGDTPVFAYLDSSKTLGVHIELVDASIRPALEQWIANA
jgi:methylmalonyl-CoA/ethylmalonyl-CoA epimerase